MERRTYLGILAGGLLASGGCTERVGTTGTTDTDPRGGQTDIPKDSWPMFQVDGGNTGFHATASGPTDSVTARWQVQADGSFGTPAVVDGTVFVGTTSGTVYAIDERDGSGKWRSSVEHGVRESPAVADGTVFVRVGDAFVRAVSAETGEGRWRVKMESDGDGVRTSPTVVGNTVFAASAGITAVDAETGSVQWSIRDPEAGALHTPAVVGDTVYVTSRLGSVYALDAGDGDRQWRYTPEKHNRDISIHSSPTIAEGTVYIGVEADKPSTTHSADGRVYALDASEGTKQWQTDTQYPVKRSLAIDGETLYGGSVSPNPVPEGNGAMWAVDMDDGATRWRTEMAGRVQSSPVVTDGIVYAGSESAAGSYPDYVHALGSSDGAERWRYELDASRSTAVVNNTVYVGGGSSMYALD